jgi:hypothetical protein
MPFQPQYGLLSACPEATFQDQELYVRSLQ